MIVTDNIELQTKGRGDIVDITAQVHERLAKAQLKNGTVTVFITGSTAGITTMEFEPGLVADMRDIWEDLIPSTESYHHDKTWGDANGYAHLRASLLGPSLVIPFRDGHLALGTWQQIVVVDFDNRPRSRQVVVQITGE